MEVASEPGVDFAASVEGGYIFPSFLPAFDAVATLVQALALLATTGVRLSRVVAGLPKVSIVHDSVVTPWDHKGLVMRTILEHSADHELVLVDGVKVLYDDGWALVLPDPEEPITHIWAEGATDSEARSRAQEYARRIRNLIRS
jgi:mannose-1-phosphate guanylyltransferase/phosphomannomutase